MAGGRWWQFYAKHESSDMSDKSDAWEAHSESWDAWDGFSRILQYSQGPETWAFLHASQSPATHLLQKQGNRRRMIRSLSGLIAFALVGAGWKLHIYYYSPLPLNLANKQQQATTTTTTTSKQARHNSVLATAPSHRLGVDSILALPEPRWCHRQIQVLSQKLSGGGPGRGRQVGRCPPKSALFWAKNSHFSPKTALVRVQNSQMKANSCYTPRVA